jgi:AcrR family transcriptional regulator
VIAEIAKVPSPKPRVRDRIIAAATKLFERHGIRGVGVDAIATEAGSNKMTLYRHFRSKEELAAECLLGQIRAAWEHWEAIIAPHRGNPRHQFEALFAAELANSNGWSHRTLDIAVIELGTDEHGPLIRIVRGFRLEIRERMREMARELEARDPGALGDALMLLMDGIQLWHLVFEVSAGPPPSLKSAVDALVDAHLPGVRHV